jgi:hypothetical protein
VQFEVGGTAIGPPVALDGSGLATTATPAFSAPGMVDVEAVFSPDDPNAFTAASATLFVTVEPAVESGTIPLVVAAPMTGTFTLTTDTSDIVPLLVNASGSLATASTTPIVVTDTRNTFPGWTVLGQASPFTGSGSAAGAFISGNRLGWTPTFTGTLPPGVSIGFPVNAANPGLGDVASVLASVPAGLGNGYGTTTLGADLTLAIPPVQAAGPYNGAIFITAMTSSP